MSFVLGALGAVAVFGLFALGVLTGWKLHKRFARPTAPPAPDTELRRLAAEQDAFRQMQHYNADIAYGIGKGWEEDETG